MSDKIVPVGGNHLSAVRKAREVLRERSQRLIDSYERLALQAAAAGDYETAEKAIRFLIEHAPADDDGTRLIDISVDRPKTVETKNSGPAIQIGVAIGGMNRPPVIATPDDIKVIEIEAAPAKDGKV